MLRRCLEKDAHRRLQHIGDAVIEINETLNVPANEPPLGVPDAVESRSASWRSKAIYSITGLIIGAIAVALILRNYAPHSEQVLHTTQRSVILLPEDQTLALSRSGPLGWAHPSLTLSPDGSHLVYVANVGETTQLFVRLMNEFQARPIPGTEGAFCPFFSPDGRWVGFLTNDKLKKVSILGGDPEILCDARNPRGGSWGDDDTICFGESQGVSIAQVPASGGRVIHLVGRVESDDRSIYQYNKLDVLPGGKWVLFSGNGNIGIVCLETGEQKILDEKGYYARYLPTGHLVYTRAGVLVTAPFDLATLKVAGDSVPVLENILLDSAYNTVQYTFSNNGLFVYVPGGDTSKCIPAWVNRQNKTELLPMPAQIYGTPKLSPDGKHLAIEVNAGAKQDVYIYDIATGRSMRLTLKGSNISPVWTPDGRRVTFLRYMEKQEKWSLFWKPVDGSGQAELLYSSQYASVPTSWSPDGNRLAFFGRRPTTKGDVWVLPLEGAREPECIIATEFAEWAPAFSPDGRYIAYTSDKDGKFQVYVRPYPDNDWVRLISDDFGEEPIWSPKGDELFYRNGDKWMAVSISTEPQFTSGIPQVLFEGPFNNVSGISYDVAPDGQRFLVLQPQYDDSQVRELRVVTNWFEELKQLVPLPEAP
jgi:serine/threonine-protein kinase